MVSFFYESEDKSINKGALITDLKQLIGPGNSISDINLVTWLNDAYLNMVDEVSKANPDYFTKSSTTSTVNGTREYTLPTDFEKALKVEIQLDGTWRRALPVANIGVISETSSGNANGYNEGSPVYYIAGGEIGFQPVPTETTADNIRMWYVYTPAELLADSDEPAFPKKFHHIIKLGAYANFLDSDEEHVAAENLRRRFDKRVADMVESMADYQVDQPKSVQVQTNTDLYFSDDEI